MLIVLICFVKVFFVKYKLCTYFFLTKEANDIIVWVLLNFFNLLWLIDIWYNHYYDVIKINYNFLDDCGKTPWSPFITDGFSLNVIVDPEDKLASGFKGQLVFATIGNRKKVKSFNWKVKHKNGMEENFYFEGKYNNNTYYWIYETKSLGSFRVVTNVHNLKERISSYFNIIEKASEKSYFNLEFSGNDFSTTKKCSITNITISGKKY